MKQKRRSSQGIDKRVSVSKKLFFVVFISSSIVTAIVIVAGLFLQYRSELEWQEKDLRYFEDSIIPSLELAIWNLDREQLTSLVKGVLTSQNVVRVKIEDAGGVLVDLADMEGVTSPSAATSATGECRVYVLNHQPDVTSAREFELGKLQICIDRGKAMQRVYESLTWIVLTQTLKTFVISFIFFLIFRNLVTRHLERISEYLRFHPIAATNVPDLRLERKNTKNSDELDVFVDAVNNLYQNSATYQAELLRVKDQAQRASEIKSLFLTSVSHELRTPLNSILGMIEMLQSAPLDLENKAYLFAERKAAEHLKHLIDDILDLLKIESDQIVVENAPFNLIAVIEFCVAALRDQFLAKGNLLKFEPPRDFPPLISGDRDRMAQVLLNLLTNANKFTEAGTVNLTLAVRGESFFLEVKDSGVGIPQDVIDDIFNPFLKFDMRRNGWGTGLGIGLAVCKGLVEKMSGRISVMSTTGSGSAFVLEMPLRPEVARVALVDATTSDLKMAEVPDMKRVLVVDDALDNQNLMNAYLQRTSCKINFAKDGKEAVAAFVQAGSEFSGFDVIYMDLLMPLMNGFEATKAIRELERKGRLPRTPIVAVTACTDKDNLQAALAAGCDDYLLKPLTKAELLRDLAKRSRAIPSAGSAANFAPDAQL